MSDNPSDFGEFRSSVLGEATDDWLGVYEVWWEANRRYPDVPLSRRLALAERVVSELLADGSLRLYRRPLNAGSYRLVPSDEIEAVLSDWASWVPQPEPAEIVWLST